MKRHVRMAHRARALRWGRFEHRVRRVQLSEAKLRPDMTFGAEKDFAETAPHSMAIAGTIFTASAHSERLCGSAQEEKRHEQSPRRTLVEVRFSRA